MDQASNGLNTTTKSNPYDLACRYNNLFQYNPAMAAAAAAAAYGLFNKNNNNNSSSNSNISTNIINGSSKNQQNEEEDEEEELEELIENDLNGKNNEEIKNEPDFFDNNNEEEFNNNLEDDNDDEFIGSNNNLEDEDECDEQDDFDTRKLKEKSSNSLNNSSHQLDNTNTNNKQRKPTNSYESVSDSAPSIESSVAASPLNENEINNEANKDIEPMNQATDMDDFADQNQQKKQQSEEINDQDDCLKRTRSTSECSINSDCSKSNNKDDLAKLINKNTKKSIIDLIDNKELSDYNNNNNNNNNNNQCLKRNDIDSDEHVKTKKFKSDNNDNKFKTLSPKDLTKLKDDLIKAVNKAIQNTLENFYNVNFSNMISNNENKQNLNSLENNKSQQLKQHSPSGQIVSSSSSSSSANSQLSIGSLSTSTNSSITSSPNNNNTSINNNNNNTKNSQNFNVSKILDKTSSSWTNKSANNLNDKRKICSNTNINTSNSNNNFSKTSPSPSAFNIASNKSLLTAAQNTPLSSAVNQFYNAALSHLQNNSSSSFTNHYSLLQNGSNPTASIPNSQQQPSFPAHPFHHSLTSSGNSSSSASSSASSTSSNNQSSAVASAHHQFLLAMNAAAAAGTNSTNYLHMAAAANRLFTPWMDHSTPQVPPPPPQPPVIPPPPIPTTTNSTQQVVKSPHQSSVTQRHHSTSHHFGHHGHHGHHFKRSFGSSLFHHAPKRRRTKVTDTRLSPRNAAAAASLRASLMNGSLSNLIHNITSSVKNKLGGDRSPNNLNQTDDQENLTQELDDNNDDDNNNNNTNNVDDNDDNEFGNQLATMPNGYPSSNGNYDLLNTSNNQLNNNDLASNSSNEYTGYQTSTLSSLHLRKAKLMFFFTRYPSSQILRNYFPDVKFNKANTAQLVKWFSNFREFFYIQMEKYARQHLAEGVQHANELHVDFDSEIFRTLNSHYNRNNQIEIPQSFCYVIEATLREFFKAIQESKDLDPSWKKAIYKVIARMDDTLPDYFKSIKWMETLESHI